MARATVVLICLALAVNAAPAQTLAPGKPAGTQAAQYITQHGVFIVASLVAVSLVFALPGGTPTSTSTATSTATTG
jgi:hypothetical protein